jgi:putative hydrolase of the HAD superfamily
VALKAVIFDYGKVLSGPPDPEAWEALLRITGIRRAEFECLYWLYRPEYDTAEFTGRAYWEQIAADARIELTEEAIEELIDWDARVWTTEHLPMIAWSRQLRERGLRTAILSNMCDHVLDRMKKAFGWLNEFDPAVWSYQLGIAKPDEAIYRYVLAKLNLSPRDVLFLDDKQPNVETARALGMRAHQFTTTDELRNYLVSEGLDLELPLPD